MRLMAPILSFTTDEVWQFMKHKKPSPSVHSDLFLPIKEEYKDAALAGRWEDIRKIRREVTKALEMARRGKMIGHSLDASVILGLSLELIDRLNPYKDQLRSIFIVSSVHMVPEGEVEEGLESEEIKGLRVKVSLSGDEKCERCWVHDPTVGDDSQHPTICKRCLEVLDHMGYITA